MTAVDVAPSDELLLELAIAHLNRRKRYRPIVPIGYMTTDGEVIAEVDLRAIGFDRVTVTRTLIPA